MMRAKTLVADGYWSRIGSTNLNIFGLLTNWELDLLVEDRSFGAEMEAMLEEDLANAREIRLGGTGRRRKAQPERPLGRKDRLWRGSTGSGPRALSRATQVGAAAIRVDSALNEHGRGGRRGRAGRVASGHPLPASPRLAPGDRRVRAWCVGADPRRASGDDQLQSARSGASDAG